MNNEWKSTLAVACFAGLGLSCLIVPLFFLADTLPSGPMPIIGSALLFPLTGFIAGRKAKPHPIWASTISALVASLAILVFGLATSETSSTSPEPGFIVRFVMAFSMFQLAMQMWIQQTVLLVALSIAGGGVALLINKREEKPSNNKQLSMCRSAHRKPVLN